MLLRHGVPIGQNCAMYNQTWDASYATNLGMWDQQGDEYTIVDSFVAGNVTHSSVCVS